MKPLQEKLIRRVRLCIWIIITGLALSGITAFPIETELGFLVKYTSASTGLISSWLSSVYNAVKYTNQTYPYLSYGTDWLAFAHIMLAVLFAGVLKDPVKNVWVIQFGIIAAVSIFALAFIAGGIRGIPFFWRLIDCSFGVVTLIVLLPCYGMIKKMERLGHV